MDILQTFLDLTEHVIPYGHESKLTQKLLNRIPKDIQLYKDSFGNLYCNVGTGSTTIFTSHLDTVTTEYKKINHIITESHISSDGTTILGGDNKAGVTILLWMIYNKIPGLYYFFVGEEVGCKGSTFVFDNFPERLRKYKKAIAFDRKEKYSIITYQRGKRTASDKFANSLAKEFQKNGMSYRIDPNGVCTDTEVFTSIIPECTNLSSGVYNEHTTQEKLDTAYFLNLCETVIKIDWESLVIDRNPKVIERTSKAYRNNSIGYTSTSNKHKNQQQQQSNKFRTFDNLNSILKQNSANEDFSIANQEIDIENNQSIDITRDLSKVKFSDTELIDIFYNKLYPHSSNKKWNEDNGLYITEKEKTLVFSCYNNLRKIYFELENDLDVYGFCSKQSFIPDKNIVFEDTEDSKAKISIKITWDSEIYINDVKTYKILVANRLKEEIEKVRKFDDKKTWSKEDYVKNNKLMEYFGESEDTKINKMVLKTSSLDINVTSFIQKNGGDIDTFLSFIQKPFITNENGKYWVGYYKIFMYMTDLEDSNSYIDYILGMVDAYGGSVIQYLEFLSNDSVDLDEIETLGQSYIDFLSKKETYKEIFKRVYNNTDEEAEQVVKDLSNWKSQTIETTKEFIENGFDEKSKSPIISQYEKWLRNANENHELDSLLDSIENYDDKSSLDLSSLEIAIFKIKNMYSTFDTIEADNYISNLCCKHNITKSRTIDIINSNTFSHSFQLDEIIKAIIKLDNKKKTYFSNIFQGIEALKMFDLNELSEEYFDKYQIKFIHQNVNKIESDINWILDNIDHDTIYRGNFKKLLHHSMIAFIIKDKKLGYRLEEEEEEPKEEEKIDDVLITSELLIDSKKEEIVKTKGNYNCSNSNLTTLKGGPKEVALDFDCSNNKLKSLIGLPELVGRNVIFSNNNIQNSLQSIKNYPPSIIKGKFVCDDKTIAHYKYLKNTSNESYHSRHEFITEKYNTINNIVKKNINIFKPLVGNKKNFHDALYPFLSEIDRQYLSLNKIQLNSKVVLSFNVERSKSMGVNLPSEKRNTQFVLQIIDTNLPSLKTYFTDINNSSLDNPVLSSLEMVKTLLNKTKSSVCVCLENLNIGDSYLPYSSWNIIDIDNSQCNKNDKILNENENVINKESKISVTFKNFVFCNDQIKLDFDIVKDNIYEWFLPIYKHDIKPILIGVNSITAKNLIGKKLGDTVNLWIQYHGYKDAIITDINRHSNVNQIPTFNAISNDPFSLPGSIKEMRMDEYGVLHFDKVNTRYDEINKFINTKTDEITKLNSIIELRFEHKGTVINKTVKLLSSKNYEKLPPNLFKDNINTKIYDSFLNKKIGDKINHTFNIIDTSSYVHSYSGDWEIIKIDNTFTKKEFLLLEDVLLN